MEYGTYVTSVLFFDYFVFLIECAREAGGQQRTKFVILQCLYLLLTRD